MSPPRPIIIEDDREQTPLRFSRDVDVIRGTLRTGDYAIVAPDVPAYLTARRRPRKKDQPPPGFPALTASGIGEHVATIEVSGEPVRRLALLPVRVERKSLADLVMCCTTERERFEGVLQRLGAGFRPGRAVVAIEAAFGDAAAGIYHSQTIPKSVIGSTIAWHHDYGIPPMWLGDPAECARWVERWLVMALERHVEAVAHDAAEREAIQMDTIELERHRECELCNGTGLGRGTRAGRARV